PVRPRGHVPDRHAKTGGPLGRRGDRQPPRTERAGKGRGKIAGPLTETPNGSHRGKALPSRTIHTRRESVGAGGSGPHGTLRQRGVLVADPIGPDARAEAPNLM